VRSVLLEEFRSNGKASKRYELKVCPIISSVGITNKGRISTVM
jgi:hypothetical protein